MLYDKENNNVRPACRANTISPESVIPSPSSGILHLVMTVHVRLCPGFDVPRC